MRQARIEDYADQSFDWAVALDVLEHVEESRMTALPLVAPGPRHLTVLLGWRCNASCRMCWQARARRDGVAQPELPIAEFHALRDRYQGLRSIEFCSFGEPTLHPHLAEMLDRLLCEQDRWESRWTEVNLITNGSTLGRFPQLARLPGYLTVSLDSPDPVTYAAIRRGLELDRTLGSLQAFLAAPGREPGRSIGINMVLLRQNFDQVEAMAALCDSLGLRYLHLLRGATLEMTEAAAEGLGDADLLPLPGRVAALRARYLDLELSDWASGATSTGAASTPATGPGYCQAPWTRLDVGPDGQAHPCCRSYRIALGSALDGDPWQHPELVALREQLASDTLDAVRFAECAACPMRRG